MSTANEWISHLMKILVTGGNGQLGRALARLAPEQHCVLPFDLPSLDITVPDLVQYHLNEHTPDVVIHAAAMTDVDGCEADPEAARRVNVDGTANIALASRDIGARFVYISTNYVFDGESVVPYREVDQPNPISVYGRTKLDAEVIVRELPGSLTVRTAMLYDETGRNFVNTMLRLAASQPRLVGVDDQFGNPTYAGNLAEAIYALLETGASGIVHLVNEGFTSWYGWAIELFRLVESLIPVDPIPASHFQRPARPPRFGALANTRAAALGVRLPDWQDGLRRCLDHRATLSSP